MVVGLDRLRACFGMPLHAASKHLGICATAIKKVCRKLGIKKWPYREIKGTSNRMKNGRDAQKKAKPPRIIPVQGNDKSASAVPKAEGAAVFDAGGANSVLPQLLMHQMQQQPQWTMMMPGTNMSMLNPALLPFMLGQAGGGGNVWGALQGADGTSLSAASVLTGMAAASLSTSGPLAASAASAAAAADSTSALGSSLSTGGAGGSSSPPAGTGIKAEHAEGAAASGEGAQQTAAQQAQAAQQALSVTEGLMTQLAGMHALNPAFLLRGFSLETLAPSIASFPQPDSVST